MAKFIAIGIHYDTDGQDVCLPKNLIVECRSEMDVADKVSDNTGWCVIAIEDIRPIVMA